MNLFEETDRPTISFLSQEKKERIYQASLGVLEEVGMIVYHDDARRILKAAGCTIDDEGLTKIPAALVGEALKSAPNNISIYDREGQPSMDLGDYRTYFGTGSDLLYTLDSKTMHRQRCALKNVRRAALLCDALPNIDFIMSYAHPREVSAERAYLLSFQAMSANSCKPIVATAESAEDLGKMWEIAVIFRGSEEEAGEKPYFALYIEPASPLKHPFESMEKLLFCVEKGIPAIYSAAPNAGASAPMTIAGQVVQGLAECLFGLVLTQLKKEGAPFIMGMGPAILDMITSQCLYNAPEYYLGYMAIIEMSHYFDLPSWGYAGTSDSLIPDGQAAMEGGYQTLLTALAGANLNHDVGYLDYGLTGCLEEILIQEEIISLVRRLMQGVPVNDDTLARDVIKEVGPMGDFLAHPHTLKHVRSTQWRPTLLNRLGYEQWAEAGHKSLLDRARERVEDILTNHRPSPIPEEKQHAIQKLVDNFKI